jgi:hypothetical protein
MRQQQRAARTACRTTTSAVIYGGISLLGLFLLPAVANGAPQDPCAMAALAGARARAVCEAALNAKQATRGRNQEPANAPDQGNGGSGQRQSFAPPPPPPPVEPGFSRTQVVGNLYVDVQGTYPDGYGGKWTGIGTPTGIPISQTWYVNKGQQKSTIQQPVTLTAPDGSPRALFAFSFRDQVCYADITGAEGPVLLTQTPQTFRLADLHMLTPNRVSGCPFTNTVNNFSGTVTLSADSSGDVNMQYAINVYNAQRVQQYLWQSDGYQFGNAMTPELAVADIEKKKVAAAQAAAAAEAQQKAEIEHAKQVKARLARKLTPLEARIDKIVQEDSRAWLSNRYDQNSVTSAKIVKPSKEDQVQYGLPATTEVLFGHFTENDGRSATVKIALIKGSINCVMFSDESVCRPLGQPQSHGIVAGMLARAMEDSVNGSSNGKCEMETKFIDNNGKQVRACKTN